MLCAQSMERLASATFTYAGHVGGADTGAVTANICVPTTTMYSIVVTAANANTFTIRATPTSGPVMGNGMLEIDCERGAALGPKQRWGLSVTRTKRGGRTDLGTSGAEATRCRHYIPVTPLIRQEPSIHRRSLSSRAALP